MNEGEAAGKGERGRALAMVGAGYLVWLLVFGLFAWWSSQVSVPPVRSLALLAALVGSISTALVIRTTVDLEVDTGLCLILFVAFCGIIFAASHLVDQPYVAALVTNTALIGAAFSLGRALANRIPENAYLIPILIVLTLVDLWSVFAHQGLSRSIVEDPETLNQVAIRYPTPGQQGEGEGPLPIMGGMDFCFMALLLPAARRFGLGATRIFYGLMAALVVCMLTVYLTEAPLPYAPFMAMGFLVAGWGRLEINGAYLKQTAIFVLVLVAIFVALRLLFPGQPPDPQALSGA